jgi:hypothetical protein
MLAGYTFGGLPTPSNGTSNAVLPIVECRSTRACVGGDTSLQCSPGYADTRCPSKAQVAFGKFQLKADSRCGPEKCLAFIAMRLGLGFGGRCGDCDVGYYAMSGQCYACGDASLVFFLSRAVPALGIVAGTAFFFWGGIFDLPRFIALLSFTSHRAPEVVRVSCSCVREQVAGHDPVSRYSEFSSEPCAQIWHRTLRSHVGTGYCLRVRLRHVLCSFSLSLHRSSPLTRPRTQLQVLAMLGSMPGISYPSRVQSAINIAKLANLDLVRRVAPQTRMSRFDNRLGFSWCGSVCQGLLRADCNPRSRTNYYATVISFFTLPIVIVLYVTGIRFLLWGFRPALLFVRPQLKGHAFFDHSVHERTSAICLDVRTQTMVPSSHRVGYASSGAFQKVCVTGDDWAD